MIMTAIVTSSCGHQREGTSQKLPEHKSMSIHRTQPGTHSYRQEASQALAPNLATFASNTGISFRHYLLHFGVIFKKI